jgi:23S rRNA pseudouridine955/2504/2580 synthase
MRPPSGAGPPVLADAANGRRMRRRAARADVTPDGGGGMGRAPEPRLPARGKAPSDARMQCSKIAATLMGTRWPVESGKPGRGSPRRRAAVQPAARRATPAGRNTTMAPPRPATARPGPGHGVVHVTVTTAGAGQRLDNFLIGRYRTLPRSLVYRWLRTGAVRVNGRRAAASARLAEDDRVRIPPVRDVPQRAVTARPSRRLADALAAAVLHEDDALLVVDKPSGLASHGGIALGLIEALRALRPELRELELVHRLDRDTSGCQMLAKRRSALRFLHAALRMGAVRKRYLVLLAGELRTPRTIDLALARATRGGERVMTVAPGGQAARTTLRPIERLGQWTLAEAEPATGRMHQIRVHAAAIGLPLAGDGKYGADRAPPAGLRRLFLHAHTLDIPALPGGQALHVRAPLPAELEAALRALRAQPGQDRAV